MASVSGNGNRQLTNRSNVVQPYSVGFLNNDTTDTDKYNVAVYDELEKVSTSTKHLFKGLDDVQNEIKNRTKAIDALGLQVSDDFKRVWFEFNGIKQQIGTGIKIENITDLNGNSLEGYLTGIYTEIEGANGRISQAFGEIDNNYQYFIGEITQINTDVAGVTEELGIINSTGGTAMQALWGVKQNIGDVTASVGLVTTQAGATDPAKSEFYVKADAFNVFTDTDRVVPIFSVSGTTILMNGDVKITNANISGNIQSSNYTPGGSTGWIIRQDGSSFFGSTSKFGGLLQSPNYVPNSTGWSIKPDGSSEFNNITVRNFHAVSGVIDDTVTVNGSIYAKNIIGDIGDFLVNATVQIDQNVTNDNLVSGKLCTIKQQDFIQKISVVGAILMNDSVGSMNAIVYLEDPSDRLDLTKCCVGAVCRIGMGAGGTGTSSYSVIRAGSTEIFRSNALGFSNVASFSFEVPAGTGNVNLEYEIKNASNATATAQMLARYHVFTQRSGSVITR